MPARLPLIERPAASATAASLVVLMTGDGGWADADEQLARRFVARGAALVGLNMRAYLMRRKAVDTVATDVRCIAEHYLSSWGLARVLVVGYSRGADLAPFAVTRFPPALRDQTDLLLLLSPSTWANLQFHMIDLVRTVRRDDDLPVLPEVARLAGLRIICAYGSDDDGSACPVLPATLGARVVVRPGGHRITSGFDDVVELAAPYIRVAKPR